SCCAPSLELSSDFAVAAWRCFASRRAPDGGAGWTGGVGWAVTPGVGGTAIPTGATDRLSGIALCEPGGGGGAGGAGGAIGGAEAVGKTGNGGGGGTCRLVLIGGGVCGGAAAGGACSIAAD